MKALLALVLLLPVAALAADQAPPADPCTHTESECLAQVLAEHLVQAEMQLMHNEAHLRFHPPEARTADPTKK